MSMSVHLSVSPLHAYLRNNTRSVHVVVARSSYDGVLITLCVSGFVTDVMFSCNGPYGDATLLQQDHCNVVCLLTFLSSGIGCDLY